MDGRSQPPAWPQRPTRADDFDRMLSANVRSWNTQRETRGFQEPRQNPNGSGFFIPDKPLQEETLRLLITSPNHPSNGVPTHPRAQTASAGTQRIPVVDNTDSRYQQPYRRPQNRIPLGPKISEQYPRGPRLQTPTTHGYTPPVGAFGPVYNRDGNPLYAVQIPGAVPAAYPRQSYSNGIGSNPRRQDPRLGKLLKQAERNRLKHINWQRVKWQNAMALSAKMGSMQPSQVHQPVIQDPIPGIGALGHVPSPISDRVSEGPQEPESVDKAGRFGGSLERVSYNRKKESELDESQHLIWLSPTEVNVMRYHLPPDLVETIFSIAGSTAKDGQEQHGKDDANLLDSDHHQHLSPVKTETLTTSSRSEKRKLSPDNQDSPGMDPQTADPYAEFRLKLYNSLYYNQSSDDNDNDDECGTTSSAPGLPVLGNITNRSATSPDVSQQQSTPHDIIQQVQTLAENTNSANVAHAKKHVVMSSIMTDIAPVILPESGIRSPPGLSRRTIVFGDFEPGMPVGRDTADISYPNDFRMNFGAGVSLGLSNNNSQSTDPSIGKVSSKDDGSLADALDAFNFSADPTIWGEQFNLTPLAVQGNGQFEKPIELVLTEPTPVREGFDLLDINKPSDQQVNSPLAVDTTIFDTTTVDTPKFGDIDNEMWIHGAPGFRHSLRAPPGLGPPSASHAQDFGINPLSLLGFPSESHAQDVGVNHLSLLGSPTVSRPPPGLTDSRNFGSPLPPPGYLGNPSSLPSSGFLHPDNRSIKQDDGLLMAGDYAGSSASLSFPQSSTTPVNRVNSASFQMQKRSLENFLPVEHKESLASIGSPQYSPAPVENIDISMSPAQKRPSWLFTRNGYKSRWADSAVDSPPSEYLSQEDLENRCEQYKRRLQRLPALYVYGNEKPPAIEFAGAGW
ncbi:Protein of unknown function [Pyronema omphalodes CBS 100304]|uniref:Uncharacterized protein n=1 Tax=Pyronema omphalodes (strain CBS 100304) TaxID=1076935 RepID=U4KWT4_PYROM|nr:Protein of unknown function [Pyronema omphalodes CBS 100304]